MILYACLFALASAICIIVALKHCMIIPSVKKNNYPIIVIASILALTFAVVSGDLLLKHGNGLLFTSMILFLILAFAIGMTIDATDPFGAMWDAIPSVIILVTLILFFIFLVSGCVRHKDQNQKGKTAWIEHTLPGLARGLNELLH